MRAGSCKAQIVLLLRYPVRNIKNPNPSQLKELFSVLVFNSFVVQLLFQKHHKCQPLSAQIFFYTCFQWFLSLCPPYGNTKHVNPSQLKCYFRHLLSMDFVAPLNFQKHTHVNPSQLKYSFLYLFSMVFVSPVPYQKLQNGNTSQLKYCFRLLFFVVFVALSPPFE